LLEPIGALTEIKPADSLELVAWPGPPVTPPEQTPEREAMLHTHCLTTHITPHHARSRPSSEYRSLYITLILPAALLCWLALPAGVSAQGLELAGGWAHITGNNGTDGFNVGAAWNFTNHIQIAGDYDTTWDDTVLGTFQLTPLGNVTSKSHLQDWLFGPRIFFYNTEFHERRVNVFGEAQFGISHLKSELELVNAPSVSTTDNSFSWMVGGGVDYAISRHWTARGKLDLLRTHFANTGQSRLRLGIGVAYTFGARER
jgi:opacity protein-like surface antigen